MHGRRQVVGSQHPGIGEDPENSFGGLLGGGDQGDVLTHHVGDDAGQQGIVRAAQDEGVDAAGRDRVKVGVGHCQQLIARSHAGLDEADETRTGLAQDSDLWGGCERVDIGLALVGRLRGDDADLVVAGGCNGSADRRADDLDDRDVVAFACIVQHRSRGGVAGDHQSLDAPVHETVEALK